MRAILRRAALVPAASLVLAALLPAPGGAQTETTTETTISYAANASSTGFLLAITPPDSEPALAVTAAATEGSITSDGPAASGSAEVAAAADETAARAATDAPPDAAAQEQSDLPAATIPLPIGSIDLGVIQGEASSSSEAEDGFPSTENDASFSGAEIDLGVQLPEPFGAIGGNVTVLGGSTASDAVAAGEQDVAATAVATGLEVSANLDIELLDDLCAQFPPGPLQDACQALVGTGDPAAIDVTLGSSNVECTWDGEDALCDGGAATATIEVLGQEPVEVAPGETVTIPPDPGPDDPFLVRVALGTFEATDEQGTGGGPSSTEETHEASGVATGLSVELLGAAASGPGLITVEVGESTAGISSRVASREIIARTGGNVLPLLLGGTALVALAVSLRRYLKRA